MVASPEICRQNGAKSRGPKTERGKAIASRNATKHGVLTDRPPLLNTEDLESFQGMMQGLIDEYQPESPIEHMLIQQIAMGWLRLHRLWGVEAAVANLEVLRAQRSQLNVYNAPKVDDSIASLVEKHKDKNFKQEIAREVKQIHEIINDLTRVMSKVPTDDFACDEWLDEIREALYHSAEAIRPAHAPIRSFTNPDFWQIRDLLLDELEKIDVECPSYEIPVRISGLDAHFMALGPAVESRLSEAENLEKQIIVLDQAIIDAQINAKGLKDTELFIRYEKHISRQIDNACDRLQKIQEQRKYRSSMGSFGQPS